MTEAQQSLGEIRAKHGIILDKQDRQRPERPFRATRRQGQCRCRPALLLIIEDVADLAGKIGATTGFGQEINSDVEPALDAR